MVDINIEKITFHFLKHKLIKNKFKITLLKKNEVFNANNIRKSLPIYLIGELST